MYTFIYISMFTWDFILILILFFGPKSSAGFIRNTNINILKSRFYSVPLKFNISRTVWPISVKSSEITIFSRYKLIVNRIIITELWTNKKLNPNCYSVHMTLPFLLVGSKPMSKLLTSRFGQIGLKSIWNFLHMCGQIDLESVSNRFESLM